MSSSSLVYPIHLSDYHLSHLLGIGTYGEVRYGLRSSTNEKVAVKLIDITRYAPSTQQLMRREISILQNISHDHCIGLVDVRESVPLKGRYCEMCGCTDGNSSGSSHSHNTNVNDPNDPDPHSSSPICLHCQHDMDSHSPLEVRNVLLLAQELAVGGEVFNVVSHNGPLPEDFVRYYFHQIVNGIEYLHRHRTYHRDLKLENLVFDHNFNIKIIDFGLAAWKPKEKKKKNGNLMGNKKDGDSGRKGKSSSSSPSHSNNNNNNISSANNNIISSSLSHSTPPRNVRMNDMDDNSTLDEEVDGGETRSGRRGRGSDDNDNDNDQQFKLEEEEEDMGERDRDTDTIRASSRSSGGSSSSSSDEDLNDNDNDNDNDILLEEPVLHTGVGCVESSTLIRLSDYSLKMASEILPTDSLMNEDGNPQYIHSISKGEASVMFQISPSFPSSASFAPHLVTANHDIVLRFHPSTPFFPLPSPSHSYSPRLYYLNKSLQLHHISLPTEMKKDHISHPSPSLIARLSAIVYSSGDSITLPQFTMKITPTQFMKLSSRVQSLFSPVFASSSSASLLKKSLPSSFLSSPSSSPLTIRITRKEGRFTFYGFHVSDPRHNIILSDGLLTGNSLPYSSPEVFYREVYQNIPYKGSAADIWSCGVILYILLLAKPPFLRSLLKTYGTQYKRDKHFIAFMRGETYGNISPSAKDLISKMMKLNPSDRLTLKQIKQHEFYRGPLPSDDVVKSVMEEKSIKMWTRENKMEMVQLIKILQLEEEGQRAMKMNTGTSQAINIPMQRGGGMGMGMGMGMGTNFMGDMGDDMSSTSPPFSLINPPSLPASFAMTPSLHSLSFNPNSAADYLAQHERNRGVMITPLSSSPNTKIIFPHSSSPILTGNMNMNLHHHQYGGAVDHLGQQMEHFSLGGNGSGKKDRDSRGNINQIHNNNNHHTSSSPSSSSALSPAVPMGMGMHPGVPVIPSPSSSSISPFGLPMMGMGVGVNPIGIGMGLGILNSTSPSTSPIEVEEIRGTKLNIDD